MLKAAPATDDEVRQSLEKKRGSVKYPVPKEMREGMINDLWFAMTKHYPAATPMDAMMSILGLLLEIETASRGCNWTGKYAMKTCDLRYQVQSGAPAANGTEQPYREVRGQDLASYIQASSSSDPNARPEWFPQKVKQVAMDHLHTKNGKPVENITIARRQRRKQDCWIS